MSKLIEETNKIIGKINKNLSDTLRRAKAEVLLDEIKDDLEALRKDAEENYKKIVDKKVEELQSIIDKNLEEEPAWTTTQDNLSKIKKGLEGLQNEIKELERKAQEEERKLEKEESELNEWKTEFPGKTAKEVSGELAFVTKQSLEFLKKLEEMSEGSNTAEDINKISGEARKMAEEYVSKLGQSAIPVIGPLVGTFYGAYHGTWMAGVYTFDKVTGKLERVAGKAGVVAVDLTKDGMKYVDEARKDLKDFTSDTIHVGADSVEKFRKGAENVTVESIGLLKESIRGGVGIKSRKFSAGIGISGTDSLEKQLETKEEKIKDLEKRLAERKAEIAELTNKLAEQAEKGQGNLMNVIEMMTNKK